MQLKTTLALAFFAAIGLAGIPAANAQTFVNGDFESPNIGTGYVYDIANAGWTFTGNSGISGPSSAFTSGNTGDATQIAFLQTTGNFSQNVDFSQVGQSYQLTFDVAQRGNYGGQQQDFNVLFNNTVIGTFQPVGTNYQTLTTNPFAIVNSGANTISFQGIDTLGTDQTVFIDNVALAAVPEPSQIAVLSLGLLGLGSMAFFARKRKTISVNA